ncbi:Peptide ABC transporter, permease protein [Desulfurococcus amylolyticus 1221n]|uniref:Peptide ABC transporter, permease protein n=1 Tax=Desulfurococcus amylolyticus (strain DSM 18924 / JCM 16383 / VKM B-2413 / 1221n) TaxID=490899 RepID=B8D510_DESA1|nr:ABC transporter permease [Desulfurococcus amylolyticus]ACL11191.1 Peptide ABC transporter, permease protein [Desulfurococcus amylolyticus 1221n]
MTTGGSSNRFATSLTVLAKDMLWEIVSITRRNSSVKIGLTIILVYIVLTALTPYITSYRPEDTDPSSIFQPPNSKHWFGTDEMGRDLFTLNIYSIKTSLIVGLSAAAITAIIGLVVGLISGYYGGLVDEVLMQVVNFLLTIPSIVLMIVIGSIIGSSIASVILIIGLLNWSPIARVVRSIVLSLKEWAYIEAARSLGASNSWIIIRHILPAVIPVTIANTVLSVSTAIFSHAALVFMGVGSIGDWNWGLILYNAYTSGALTAGIWWYFIPPGTMLVALAYSIMLIGNGLEKEFNPRLPQTSSQH